MRRSDESPPTLPTHLNGTEAAGFTPGARVHQYEQGPMQNFTYLITSDATKEYWIVDPHREWAVCERDARAAGFESLAGCLLTHSHHDHVAGLPTLLATYPDLEVTVGAGDAFRLEKWTKEFPRARFRHLDGDATLDLGGLKVEAIHSPGHSEGEFCYALLEERPPLLLSGDVLFVRQCGRTDFAGGSDTEMFATLARLKGLPPETVILPGHHYTPECASVLATELRESAPLLARTWEELRDLP